MQLILKKVNSEEKPQIFKLFKKYMKPVIECSIGWDEEFQENGFNNHLKLDWFRWVVHGNQIVGLVCFKIIEDRIHVHLLIIFEAHQRKGYGRLTTTYLYDKATKSKKSLNLSCFKNNKVALSLYKNLEFKIESEDENFYNLSRT